MKSLNLKPMRQLAPLGKRLRRSSAGQNFRGMPMWGKVVSLIIGFLVIMFTLSITGGAQGEGEAEIQAIPVSVMAAEHASLAPEVTVYGRVENPNTTTIEASTLAYVQEVFVREGQSVATGELLVQLDPRDARLLVRRAEATLNEAQSSLARLNAQQIADRRNFNAQKELYEITRRKEQRYETLYGNGQMSLSALEDLKQQRLQQEITLNQQELVISTQEAAMVSAVAGVENAAANLEQAELNLERLAIVAPFDGKVTQVNAAIGRRVATGQPVITLFDEDNHQVRVSLPADTAQQIAGALSNAHHVKAEALLGGNWVAMNFLEVGAEVRSGRAGTDLLLALPENSKVALGRALEVRVTLPTQNDLLAVPVQSVYGDQIIYTVEDEVLKAVKIERIGSREDDEGNMQILISANELERGAPIITSSLSRASSGTRVAILGTELASAETPEESSEEVSITAAIVTEG